MTPQEFRELLIRAVNGEHRALEEIFSLYMPLINQYSMINGKLDEDCQQYILIHIALNIGKFKI